jgi:CubicO group peptidase (beta-lactamase class C family)
MSNEKPAAGRIAGTGASMGIGSGQSAEPSSVKPMSHAARIAAAAEQAVATGDIPGVVCLVWRRGELLQVESVGLRNIEARLPVERNTIFRIASMSKPVTTAAAMILRERGLLRLEDPIIKWAPEFAEMRVLRRADSSLQDTYPAPRPITIEDLMTHRSGLAYSFTARGPLAQALKERFGFEFDSARTPDEWMQTLASLPLSHVPGERFIYGHSTDLLGVIIGRATGLGTRAAMRQLLFDPLGMVDTDFWIPPEKRDRAAVLYRSSAPGNFVPIELPGFMGPTPPSFSAGGQGLVSTADDYLGFARMLLQGGELGGTRVLAEESIRLMTTNRLTPAQRRTLQFGIPFFMGQGFGLGLSVIDDAKRNAWMGAGRPGAFGWPGLFGGWWQVDPAQQTVLLWLQQTLPPGPIAGAGAKRDSRISETLLRFVFSSPKLLSLLNKMAQRSGKAPRLPGSAATQKFQREAYAALHP